MNKPTSNLPETIAAGETISGVQICPFGEYANGKTMQVCDETAFGQIAGNTSGEVLCDFEHKSEDPSPTSDTATAAALPLAGVDARRGGTARPSPQRGAHQCARMGH